MNEFLKLDILNDLFRRHMKRYVRDALREVDLVSVGDLCIQLDAFIGEDIEGLIEELASEGYVIQRRFVYSLTDETESAEQPGETKIDA